MERTKEFLTLAPFMALVVAVTYLQGYWGYFDILAFPYLSLQEILAYSAAPFFGFVILFLIGLTIGIATAGKAPNKTNNKIFATLEFLAMLIFLVLLVYYDVPQKWIWVPLAIIIISMPFIFSSKRIIALVKASPSLFLVSFFALILLIGAFGYGRMQAELVLKAAAPDTDILSESGSESVNLVGKLNEYYFFLNSSRKIEIIQQKDIKKIEFRRVYKES